MHWFFMVFGSFWTLITAIITFGMYGNTGGDIYVNGVLTSQAEFNEMLWPKLFIGIFWAIGLGFLFAGLKGIYKNFLTEAKGELCYGRILKMYRTGTTVNGIPELKADFLIIMPDTGETKIVSETIGLSSTITYDIGEYFELKIYKDDINIVSRIYPENIPDSTRILLDNESNEFLGNINMKDPETVVIDGVEYVRAKENKAIHNDYRNRPYLDNDIYRRY